MTTDNPDQIVLFEFSDDMVYLRIADGRMIGNPLSWHPWLATATPEQRKHVEMYELSVY